MNNSHGESISTPRPSPRGPAYPGPVLLLAGLILLGSCGAPIPGFYGVELPSLPPAWEALLGGPSWRLEWVDAGGRLQRRDLAPGQGAALELPEGLAVPVLAYPFWPRVPPGTLRPAGAIFPHDAGGGRIRLSWRAGVEAAFYLALAAAAGEGPPLRQGPHFDWPRFRKLLAGPDIPEPIRRDPWLADWPALASATVRMGFDRRRIKEAARETQTVQIPQDGPWIGPSPFAAPESWEAGSVQELGLCAAAESYISPGGILRLTRGASLWLPWE